MIDFDIDEGSQRPWQRIMESFPFMEGVVLDSAGKQLSKALRDAIQNQSLSWPALKESTYDAKITRASSQDPMTRSNFPTDTWRDTGALWSSIRWQKRRADGEDVVDVGLFEDAGDRVIAAAVLEYGSKERQQPPRPLFRPVSEQVMHDIQDDLQTRVDRVISDATGGRIT